MTGFGWVLVVVLIGSIVASVALNWGKAWKGTSVAALVVNVLLFFGVLFLGTGRGL